MPRSLGGTRRVAKTIEERNEASLELVEAAAIPRLNWTIADNGDIIAQASTKPTKVHMWHATTCNSERRDFRLINLDDPCTCGVKILGQCQCTTFLAVAVVL